MSKALKIKNITKKYKNTDFYALKDVNLTVEKGEILGLLGPNGAGKTSLISILTGLIQADEGSFFIEGEKYKRHQNSFKDIIGVVPQEYALYPKLTAKENLLFFGSMYGLRKELKSKIDDGIRRLGLEKFANKKIETYSGGMKRRINLLAGVMHNPRILFLDEPTVGVDVQSKNVIIEFLKELNEQGTTIVYTSHLLTEAQYFCTNIAIIDGGRIIKSGTTESITNIDGKVKSLEEIFIESTGKGLRDYV